MLDVFRAKKLPVIQVKEIHRPDAVDFGRKLDGSEGIHCIETHLIQIMLNLLILSRGSIRLLTHTKMIIISAWSSPNLQFFRSLPRPAGHCGKGGDLGLTAVGVADFMGSFLFICHMDPKVECDMYSVNVDFRDEEIIEKIYDCKYIMLYGILNTDETVP